MKTLRILIAMLALAAASEARAVDVCRLAKTETDRVSGATTVSQYRYHIDLAVKDGVGTASMQPSLVGLKPALLPAGTPILMLLENGTRVTFFTSRDVDPSGTILANQYGASTFTGWSLDFAVSSEAAHAIAQSPPVAMRYTIAAHEFKPDYTDAYGHQLQSMFACAAHHLK